MNLPNLLTGRAYLIGSLLGILIFIAGWSLWTDMPFPIVFLWGVITGILTALIGKRLDEWIESAKDKNK